MIFFQFYNKKSNEKEFRLYNLFLKLKDKPKKLNEPINKKEKRDILKNISEKVGKICRQLKQCNIKYKQY